MNLKKYFLYCCSLFLLISFDRVLSMDQTEKSSAQKECAICYEAVSQNCGDILQLPCSHCFHRRCLKELIGKNLFFEKETNPYEDPDIQRSIDRGEISKSTWEIKKATNEKSHCMECPCCRTPFLLLDASIAGTSTREPLYNQEHYRVKMAKYLAKEFEKETQDVSQLSDPVYIKNIEIKSYCNVFSKNIVREYIRKNKKNISTAAIAIGVIALLLYARKHHTIRPRMFVYRQ
ncbi:MAG: hypothetical protein UU47_C0003G0049 [candidate division TM6 bacterium GW2011_GWE2_41_16]|nr:MAG: hypothetical protein UU47_C0003G0049 [candidate division TM6 bacterium GW2011_GWE2_41_16]